MIYEEAIVLIDVLVKKIRIGGSSKVILGLMKYQYNILLNRQARNIVYTTEGIVLCNLIKELEDYSVH